MEHIMQPHAYTFGGVAKAKDKMQRSIKIQNCVRQLAKDKSKAFNLKYESARNEENQNNGAWSLKRCKKKLIVMQ